MSSASAWTKATPSCGARKPRGIRGYFRTLAGACGKTDEELRALAGQLIQAEKAEQRRYDSETDHGQRSERQAAWTDEVTRRLQ